MPMFSSILKQISILCFLFVLTLSLEATVFVKTRGGLYNAIDKLPSTLEYSFTSSSGNPHLGDIKKL